MITIHKTEKKSISYSKLTYLYTKLMWRYYYNIYYIEFYYII